MLEARERWRAASSGWVQSRRIGITGIDLRLRREPMNCNGRDMTMRQGDVNEQRAVPAGCKTAKFR